KLAQSSMSSIVSTTDTIAKYYLELKSSSPELSDKKIYEQIIEIRYSIRPLREGWRYESILNEIKNISNLKLLIFEILTNEAPDLLKSGNENLVMTLEIIERQLEEYGLK
ncbi:hypothetical protein KJ591_03860, partial [Patescibacteria group bacterium]|nr:hypothetical protein [Patescibacteria group bacterium]